MGYLKFIKTLQHKKIKTIDGENSFKLKVLDDEEKVEFILSDGEKRTIKFASLKLVLKKQIETNSYIASDYSPAQNVSYHLALIKMYRRHVILMNVPEGNDKPSKQKIISFQYSRDPKVSEWVLANADGKCDCCDKKAPFIKDNLTPHLEIHHVKRLADNGPDTPDNTIAICPNCHRELHFGLKKQSLTKKLYKKISRLKKVI